MLKAVAMYILLRVVAQSSGHVHLVRELWLEAVAMYILLRVQRRRNHDLMYPIVPQQVWTAARSQRHRKQ